MLKIQHEKIRSNHFGGRSIKNGEVAGHLTRCRLSMAQWPSATGTAVPVAGAPAWPISSQRWKSWWRNCVDTCIIYAGHLLKMQLTTLGGVFVVGLHMLSAGTTPVRQHSKEWDSRCSPFFFGVNNESFFSAGICDKYWNWRWLCFDPAVRRQWTILHHWVNQID